MRIGPLRHRVAIQTGTPSQDEYGGVTLTFSTVATVWASVEPMSGRELVSAQQQHAETSHRIRVRYTANVTQQSRIVWESRTFEVVSLIDNKEEKRMIELMCKEIS